MRAFFIALTVLGGIAFPAFAYFGLGIGEPIVIGIMGLLGTLPGLMLVWLAGGLGWQTRNNSPRRIEHFPYRSQMEGLPGFCSTQTFKPAYSTDDRSQLAAGMISHVEFGKLRLAQYLPRTQLRRLRNWEFMDRIWVGEALNFSEWLRLESEPDVLRSLAIAFEDFPSDGAEVLRTLKLPLRPGMTLPAIQKVLGEPVKEYHFVDDRVTYEFITAEPTYDVSCTILNNGGLSYIVVMQPLPPEWTGPLGRIIGRFWEILTLER